MKVLLDECIPKRLKRELSGYDLLTVPEAGWAGQKNGKLLALAEQAFDVFITIDQNLQYQQKLSDRKIAVILISPQNSKFDTLRRFVPKIKLALEEIEEKQFIQITEC